MTRPIATSRDEKSDFAPKLRFPEFQRDPWQEKLIGDFLEESRLKGSSGDIARKLTVKLWGKGVFEKVESLSGSENTQYYRRSAGQFIYSKLDFLNGAFGVIPPELDGLESTIDLPCFDISNELHPNFLLEYVKRPAFYEKFGEIADGGRKAKRIQAESFLSFPIRVPLHFTEQQKIAECLSTLDELIGAESQKLDALKTHKNGLLQQLFPREGETLPRLRFPEFHSAPEWEERPLESLAKRGSGHTPNKSHPEYYDGGIKWISLADSRLLDNGLISETKSEISEEGLENSSAVLHPAGTVLVSRDAGVGKSAVMASAMAVSQHFIVWTCDSTQLSNWFLYYLLQKMKPLFERAATGSTIKTIGLQFFIDLTVTVPAPEEQHRIASCLTSLDDLIAAQTDRLETLQTHKQGLLQQLFPNSKEIDI